MAKSIFDVKDMIEDPSAWTEWLPLTSLKYSGTYHPNEKVSGIYQISDKKSSEVINPDIGYIGKSNNVEGRVWNVGTGIRGVQSSQHSCGKWLLKEGYKPEEIYYRILFVSKEQITKAENLIHDKMNKMYGYRFKWIASGENKLGRDFQLREQINDLSPIQIVEDVLPMIERKIGRELLISILNKEIVIRAAKD